MITCNFITPSVDIDFVIHNTEHIAFVKVRYRGSAPFRGGIPGITTAKHRRLKRCAALFASRKKEWSQNPCRFDVIAYDAPNGDGESAWIRVAFDYPKTSGCDCTVDFYPLISDFFQRHLETTSLAVDGLVEATSAAVEQAAEAILNERKLFSIGLGADCAGATALASLLHRGVLRERPSLPVVELAEHHIESVGTGVNWAGQRIQALGQLGDVAFVFAASLSEPEIQRLAVTLEQRQVRPIWVGNRGPGLSMTVVDENVETRLTLNGALAICLARLIDTHTFGPMGD